MNFEDTRFGEPVVLAALAIVPVLVALAWFESRRRAQASVRYGGPPALRLGVAPGRRLLRTVLLIAAVTLLILAAARPQWGFEQTEAEQRGIDIAIVLDVSRSMLATDVQPSRAGAAARGIREMLGHLDGNRVALVTFAGTAFTRSPLTVDLPALANLVDRAQGDSPLVQAGTDLSVAIDAAVLLLAVADRAGAQAILLVSDGEDLGPGVQSAIDRAREQDMAIYTVFAGTTNPTALPASSGGSDITRADPRTLEAIARGTGGTLRDVRGMAGLAVDFRRLRQTQFEVADTRVPRDRFPWFLGGALALLMAQALLPGSGETPLLPRPRLPLRGRTRRAAAVTALSVLTLALGGCAAVGGAPAYRQVEAGNRHFTAERFTQAELAYREALALLPDDLGVQYNLANALIRLGRLPEALATIDGALTKNPEAMLTTRLLYSAGNAALQAGDLPRALAAYQQVLRLDPGDQDAKANLELVLRRLPPPAAPAPPPGAQDSQPGDQGQQGQQGEQGQQGQDGQQRPPGQPGDQGQPGAAGQASPQPAQSGGSAPGAPTGRADPNDPEGRAAALAAANQELEAALAALGPEVSPEEAAQILALAQRANDLAGLTPRDPRGGIPPR